MIKFEIIDDKLIAIFLPEYGIDELLKKIKEEGHYLKNTFYVDKENLIEDITLYDEKTISFYVGKKEGNLIKLDKKTMDIKNNFYFPEDYTFKRETFIALYNISIISRIDSIIDKDLYIGVEQEQNSISIELFDKLIKLFPNRTELKKYTEKRISLILKESLNEIDKYEFIYEKYLSKKEDKIKKEMYISKNKLKIAYEQFSTAISELEYMLENEQYFSEKDWQIRIFGILQLLYPKYIHFEREMSFSGIDSYDKRPDFILVDANGFIDILEIKKPNVSILSKNMKYRNNYVPVRELSGTVQQVEKYIYCLNNLNSNNIFFKTLEKRLPNCMKVKVLNPNGMIILGRSNEFNEQKVQDFELIKRQYKNIAEIITYDDLLIRLKNIVSSLENRI